MPFVFVLFRPSLSDVMYRTNMPHQGPPTVLCLQKMIADQNPKNLSYIQFPTLQNAVNAIDKVKTEKTPAISSVKHVVTTKNIVSLLLFWLSAVLVTRSTAEEQSNSLVTRQSKYTI